MASVQSSMELEAMRAALDGVATSGPLNTIAEDDGSASSCNGRGSGGSSSGASGEHQQHQQQHQPPQPAAGDHDDDDDGFEPCPESYAAIFGEPPRPADTVRA